MSASIERFLSTAGWGAADRRPLAGDASHRRYERLRHDDQTAVLMIAPPERGEDVRPFMLIADYLRSLGLSAPAILAADADAGLLLLEDLGDGLYARAVAGDLALEREAYGAAVDLLSELHAYPPPAAVPRYDPQRLAELAGLAWHWYAGGGGDPAAAEEFENLFASTEGLGEILALRDYHAENLVWLPGRDGIRRVGLLDFQDAMAGHRAYDLVSLLEDARRDVPDDLREDLIARYVAASGVAPRDFRRAFALLGAQRNLRILGVFARLCRRDGKPGYLRFVPRVWAHLMRDLSHPELARLRRRVISDLPEPTPNHLRRLEARCAPTA